MVLDLGLINDLATAKSGKVVRLAMAIYGDGDPGDTMGFTAPYFGDAKC
jgi:hypothetical protein